MKAYHVGFGICLLIIIILLIFLLVVLLMPASSPPEKPKKQKFAMEQNEYERQRIITQTEKQKTEQLEEIYKQARLESARQFIPWKVAFRKWGLASSLCVGCVGFLLFVGLVGMSKVRRYSIVTQQIGEHSTLQIHYKLTQQPEMGMLLAGLVNAEQNRALYPEKAIEFSDKLLTHFERITRGGRALPVTPSQALSPSEESGDAVPSFCELLSSGVLARGKPMILGYEHGHPRYGSFQDIYSAAVAGESGSGKTSTLLFLIGSALLSTPAYFMGIDPHYPHPKSLGFQLKPLCEAKFMRMATYKDDMLNVLQQVETVIDYRLKQLDTETAPVVLVIDELAFLAKTSIGAAIAHAMERISTEGRKCAVYMLASSQTWLVARTGASSVVRDTLTSAYVHRIKPKQANLLLQDKNEVQKIKKYVKQAGDVLLCPVNSESVVCKMPLTTEQDMQAVVEIMKRADEPSREMPINMSKVSQNDPGRDKKKYECQTIPMNHETVREQMRNDTETAWKQHGNSRKQLIETLKEVTGCSQNELAERIRISRKDLSFFIHDNPLSDDKKQFIMDALETLCHEKNIECDFLTKQVKHCKKQGETPN